MAEKQKLDLSFLRPQFETVELPSRGKFYKGIPELEEGILHIRPMTSVEEKLIDKFNNHTFYTTVDEIISNCVQEDIDVDDLTLGDRIFTLLRIRVSSYGSMYEVRYTCPVCDSEYPINVDLAKFEPVYIDEDIEEPFELELPVCKAIVRMRIPRSGDVRESTDRSFAEQKKNGVFVSPSVYQKALCCEGFVLPDSSADAGTVIDQSDFKLLLGIMQRLHANDARAIEKLFSDYDHGMIEPVLLNCPVCKASFEQYLTLNWDFFRPRNKRKEDSRVQQLNDDVSDWESHRTSRKRTTGPSEVRELPLVGDTDSDLHAEA